MANESWIMQIHLARIYVGVSEIEKLSFFRRNTSNGSFSVGGGMHKLWNVLVVYTMEYTMRSPRKVYFYLTFFMIHKVSMQFSLTSFVIGNSDRVRQKGGQKKTNNLYQLSRRKPQRINKPKFTFKRYKKNSTKKTVSTGS